MTLLNLSQLKRGTYRNINQLSFKLTLLGVDE